MFLQPCSRWGSKAAVGADWEDPVPDVYASLGHRRDLVLLELLVLELRGRLGVGAAGAAARKQLALCVVLRARAKQGLNRVHAGWSSCFMFGAEAAGPAAPKQLALL